MDYFCQAPLAYALHFAAVLHQFRREPQAAQEQAEATMALSTEHKFPLWLTTGSILRGWALAEQGQGVEGMAYIRQGLNVHQAMAGEFWRPYILTLLAAAHGHMGQDDEGLHRLATALAVVEKTGERLWEAELHRLKGELLLRLSADNSTEAETCFHQALDMARHQGAKAWELRAAMSLARLWQQQGQRDAACDLLKPIYGWFTEGFDTADLQEAKVLLDALA